jgi:hypothetical protein
LVRKVNGERRNQNGFGTKEEFRNGRMNCVAGIRGGILDERNFGSRLGRSLKNKALESEGIYDVREESVVKGSGKMEGSVHREGHAAPSANAHRERNEEEEFASAVGRRDGNGAPHDGCVDSGLRRGRRRLSSAPAASTSLHSSERDTDEWKRAVGRDVEFCGDGIEYGQYGGDLERQWRSWRLYARRNDFGGRNLHGSLGSSDARDCERDCHEPSGFCGVRYCQRDDYQRHFHLCLARRGER